MRWWLRSLLLVAYSIGVVGVSPLAAEDAWRPIFVPPDRQDLWPAGTWVPIDADLVQPELSAALSLPSAPEGYIATAIYDATFDLNALGTESTRVPQLSGRFAWNTKRPDLSPKLINLGTPNVAIFDVFAGDSEAIWGLSDSGNSALFATEGSGKVTGRWAVTGIALQNSFGFQFSLPAALSTSLNLTVPKDFRVISENAIVVQAQSNSDAPANIWNIRPARGKPVRFEVVPRRLPKEQSSRLYRRTLDIEVSENTVSWRADLELHFTGRRPRTTTIRIPSNARVDSIFVNASPVAVTSPVTVGDQSLLQIALPADGDVQLRLDGQMPRNGRNLTAPMVEVAGGSILAGQLKAFIAPPLHLESVDASGFRQVVGALDNGSGDELEFVQTAQKGEVRLRVAPPQPKLIASELTLLDRSVGAPSRRTFLELSTTSGTAFDIAVDWPIEWSIADVRHEDNSPVESWTVSSSGADKRKINISLRQPVTPSRPERILVSGRLEASAALASTPCRPVSVLTASMNRQIIGLTVSRDAVASIPSADIPTRQRNQPQSDLLPKNASPLTKPEAIRATTPLADIAESLLGTMRFFVVDNKPTKSRLDIATDAQPERAETNTAEPLSADGIPHAKLKLAVEWPDGNSQQAHVAATFQFDGPHPKPLPSVRLPVSATWIVARSSDGPISAVNQGASWRFAPNGFSRELTIEYSLPIESFGLSERGELGFPTLEYDERRSADQAIPTRIELSLPAAHELVDLESTIQLSHDPYRVSFWTRIFGPLARPADESRFRPWQSGDWIRILWSNQLFDFNEAPRKTSTFLTPRSPEVLTIKVAKPDVAITLSWLNWWIGLAIICLVRCYRMTNWRLFTITFMGGMLGLSLVIPDELAMLTGGLVCGMGFGMLVPRYYLRIASNDTGPDADTSVVLPSLLVAFCGFILSPNLQALAAPTPSSTRQDILIPDDSVANPSPLIDGAVYVRPELAERFRARAASRGYLIRGSRFAVELDGTQFRINTTIDAVRFQPSSGVRIPLSGRVTIDAETVTVNGNQATPIPLENAIFVPVAPNAPSELVVSFSYVIPNDSSEEKNVAVSFGDLHGSNNILSTSEDINVAGLRLQTRGDVAGRRLHGNDHITFRSTVPQSAPDNPNPQEGESNADPPDSPAANGLTATGTVRTVENPLSTEFEFKLDFSDSLPISNIAIELPRNWVFKKPASVTQRSADAEATLGDLPGRLVVWSQTQTRDGIDRATVNLVSPSAANRLNIEGVGWILPPRSLKRNQSSGVTPTPRIIVNGEAIACTWANAATTTPPDSMSPDLDLGTLNQAQPGDAQVETAPAARLVSVEQTGTLRRDDLRWQANARFDLGPEPLFGLRVSIPRNAKLTEVTAASEGRSRPPRISRQQNSLELLFNGAVSGDLSLSISMSMPRPPRGRRPLPRVQFPDFGTPNETTSMTFLNNSPNPIRLLGQDGESITVWESAVAFPDWPLAGPRQILLSDRQVEAEIDYVVTVAPNTPPRLQVSLASRAEPTRRSITIPEVEADSTDRTADQSRFVTLTTLPDQTRQTVAVTNFATTNDTVVASQQPVRFASPQRGDRAQLWVAASETYARVPRAAEVVNSSAQPPWLRALIPPAFQGTVYRVDGLSLQMADRPAEIGSATISSVVHHVWATDDGELVYGITEWTFSDAGLVDLVPTHPTSINTLVVDNTSLKGSAALQSLPVNTSCVAHWTSPKTNDRFNIPAIANQSPNKESIVLHSNNVTLQAQGLAPTRIDDSISFELLEDSSVASSDSPTEHEQTQSVEAFTRTEPESIGQPIALRNANNFHWLSEAAIVIAIMIVIVGAFRLDTRQVWKRIADSVADSPRAIVALFGFAWWLFLTPSSLGFAIMLVIAGLAMFRPIQSIRNSPRGR